MNKDRNDFLILSANSVIAQVISVLFLVYVTKLYGPNEFSVLVLYSTFLLWLGPIVCLKYDVAIVIADSVSEAFSLLAGSLIISVCIGSVVLVCILANSVFNVFSDIHDAAMFWLLIAPVGIVAVGINAASRSLLHFHKDYLFFSFTPVIFSFFNGISSIILFNFYPLGESLVFSHVFSTIMVCTFIWIRLKKFSRFSYVINYQSIKWSLKKNFKFPSYSAPASLIDGASQALPVYFVALIFGGVTVASYGLVIKIAVVPFRFIFSSVSTLMLKKIHDEIKNGFAAIIFWKVASILAILIFILSLVFANFASVIVNLVFGVDWSETGKILGYMGFALLFSAAVSSLSNILAATKHLALGASWQALYFLSSLLFFFIIYRIAPIPISTFFKWFAFKEVVSYGMYFLMIAYSVHNPRTE